MLIAYILALSFLCLASTQAKLFITTNRGSKKSYVIDINNGTICDGVPDYPDTNDDVYGPAYGLINQTPMVCDGNMEFEINECYIFQDGEWQKNVRLPEPSRFSGSTVLNETTLWIAGNGNYANYSKTLSLLVNPFERTVHPGPELPSNIGYQCMVNIDGDSVMFIGGYNGTDGLDETRIYSFTQDAWEMGPPLTRSRLEPACAIITLDSKRFIFVAQYGTSEYLELDGDNAWKQGPRLPFTMYCRMNAVNGNSAILFGYNGINKNPAPIFKLICDNNDVIQCKWKQLEFSLPFQADLPVSMIIPDEIIPDCNLKENKTKNNLIFPYYNKN